MRRLPDPVWNGYPLTAIMLRLRRKVECKVECKVKWQSNLTNLSFARRPSDVGLRPVAAPPSFQGILSSPPPFLLYHMAAWCTIYVTTWLIFWVDNVAWKASLGISRREMSGRCLVPSEVTVARP